MPTASPRASPFGPDAPPCGLPWSECLPTESISLQAKAFDHCRRIARAVAPGSSRTGTAPKAWESGDPKQSVGAIRLGAVQPPEAAIHAPSGGVESMPGRY